MMSLSHTRRCLAVAGVALFMGMGIEAQAVVVSAINPAPPGDAFTNASTSNAGQLVGSNWYYNNVRNSGIVGINTQYARSGNGSARLQTLVGPGGSSSKADIELLPSAGASGSNFFSGGSLGTLGDLTGLSYEWYRSSASTNSAGQHPVLRLLLDADGNLGTTGDRGGLVFEQVYNGVPSALTNTWVASDIFNFYGAGQSANVWNFGFGVGNEFGGYNRDLQDWINGFTVGSVASPLSANSLVIGISSGVGSGWGPFDGAVDNIAYRFGTQPQTLYNFEVGDGGSSTDPNGIPEPMTAGLYGLALAAWGLAVSRRRRC